LAFGVVRDKIPSVWLGGARGVIGEHLATGSIHTKDGVGFALLKKERNEKKEKKLKIKEKREKKRWKKRGTRRVGQHAPPRSKATLSVPQSHGIAH
jgi:hypothetical protein